MPNYNTDVGAIALAHNKNRLFALSLRQNKIGDEGTGALAENSDLLQLLIGYNQITNIGALALAKSHLRILDVSYNHIGRVGLKALRESQIEDLQTEGNDEDLN